jgi:hypothetical protein
MHTIYMNGQAGSAMENIVAMETWVRILAAPALPSLEIQQRSPERPLDRGFVA